MALILFHSSGFFHGGHGFGNTIYIRFTQILFGILSVLTLLG